MKEISQTKGSPAFAAVAFCLAATALTACSGGQRLNVKAGDGHPARLYLKFLEPQLVSALRGARRRRECWALA